MRIAASLLLVVLWLVPLAGHGAAPVLYSDTLRIDAVEEPENGLDAETEINLDDEAIEITPLAGGGAGPAADDAEIDLGSIEVYGNRSLAAVLDDTRALTVITAADFAGAMTAAEVLERVPGVDVRLQGGQGQLSSVLVRGARAQQVLVLIDGQAASMESMDLALLPLGGIERIEVVRGPAAARFGPGAMGGVVNLVTHRPAAPDRGEADAATTLPLNEHRAELWPPADPADAAPLDVSVTTTAGGYSSLSTEIHAIGPGESYFISHLQARNNYEYERRGGSVATRRNNEAGRQAFWAAWNDGAYTHRMGATHLRRGVPGTAEFPTTAARLGHDALWWQTSGPGWRGDLSLSHRHFTDPDPVLNRGPVDTKTTTAQLEFAAGSLAGQPAAWGIRPRFAYSEDRKSVV